MHKFTCYGEVLWDVFSDHEKIGGAPLNVALRLKSFEDNVAIISAIGNDDLGERLSQYLVENNLTTEYLQIRKAYETGKVKVTLDGNGSARYKIKFPAAWDFIQLNSHNTNLAKNTEVFIYGSLICRNSESRDTLLELLNYANFKVFDVNLREPFYGFELLNQLMSKADFIKFNDDELTLISKHFNSDVDGVEDRMSFISKKFNASQICVTKGKDGAVLLINGQFYHNNGYFVNVKDTVGAGDSFLASLLYKITNGIEPKKALDFACAVGALVAGSEGANPKLVLEDIEKMTD